MDGKASPGPLDLLDSVFDKTVAPDGTLLPDEAIAEVPVGQLRALVRLLSERLAIPDRSFRGLLLKGAVCGVVATLGVEAAAFLILG